MKLVVDISGDNLLTEIEVSDRYDIASELCVQEYAQEDMKQFRFRNFHTDGLILIDVQTVFSQLLHAQLSFEGHVIAIVFHLSGSCRMTSTSRGSKIKEKSGDSECHNILVVQGDTLDLLFEPGMLVDSFIVLLSREFCLRVMPQEYDKYNNLLYAVEKGTDATLFSSFVPLSQEMKRIVENVRNCSRKGSFHRLCLEIKIAELLMLQLEQYQLLSTQGSEKPMFHEADVEKIEQAKKILDDNYVDPPTIKALASMVGVNETKLKADFKKTYQRTIHEYTVSLRMQKALQLITQQNLLLKEVAMEVGYQKPSNFTKVFTEFYGVHPRHAAKAEIALED